MNKKTKILIILISIVASMVIAALAFFSLHQHNQMREIVEELEFEKEALQDEYEDLAIQFDGYQKLDIQNDSLQDKLAREQQRVRDLLEELRITKVTNARRIAALKKELATVRSVMVTYVHQIDSLHQTNKRLVVENTEYRRKNEEMTQANEQLSNANNQLTQVVTRAAMLEVTDFECLTLNRHNRKTSFLSQVTKLEFHYTIQKNITCEPGNKTVYLVLRGVDGEVMQKQPVTFEYENGQVPYSVSQAIEYMGEECKGTMYWTIDDDLVQGDYAADFFIDGNLCGSFNFALKK